MSGAASGDGDVDVKGNATGAEVRDLSEREVRALTEYMVVLPPRLAPRSDERAGLYHVTGESGSSYVVDPVLGSCTCPDAKYHVAKDEACKHAARVQFERGERGAPGVGRHRRRRALPRVRRARQRRGRAMSSHHADDLRELRADVQVDGEYLKPHGARRGLGDVLYRESAELAQSALRHRSIRTTHDAYSHIDAGETAEEVGSVLDEARDGGE